jgi:glutathione S-transferase
MSEHLDRPIILFCYPGSPWSAKVEIYLALRKIPYATCHQPMTWPRPDLQALSINYRRIPLLAIGRDIYCDTALILQKLESLFPAGSLSALDDRGKAIDDLLEQWSQTAIMKTGAAFIPPTMPLLSDQTFLNDRKALWGPGFDPDVLEESRPGLLAEVELNIGLIENLLSDGRPWLQDTKKPSLADIHGECVRPWSSAMNIDDSITAAFFFQWATELSNTFLEDHGFDKKFPRAYAFLARFRAVVTACANSPVNTYVQGTEAIGLLESTSLADVENVVQENPAHLVSGQTVAVSRTDDISGHKEIGVLVALSSHESVIAVGTSKGPRLHVHCPRRNFMVKACQIV